LEELEMDFAERYSFEHADVAVCSSLAVLDHVRRIGWGDRSAGIVAAGDRYIDLIGNPQRSPAKPQAAALPREAFPLVTVVVPHYNLGRYLPEALASLAEQRYPNLEVLVIDDGSTDQYSLEIFEQMQSLYPRYRFLRQANAGIGATRNRGLHEAKGEYFLPMDADNLAQPDMVDRFVAGMQRNPDLEAMTCYFLAFEDGIPPTPEHCRYAYRPLGGPHILASIRNVYGDANALFRTATLRALGGYEVDRDTSFEDWEVFVKLVHAGGNIGVIPEHLFYYRHRQGGFSRVTDDYRNHQRVLRQFLQLDHLPPAERATLWTALFGLMRQAAQFRGRLRYRLADHLHNLCARVPLATRSLKWLFRTGSQAWNYLMRQT
jgi:glycosyltransferase involved in cell wall biosynthesis